MPRLDIAGGIDTVTSPDLIQQGYPYLQNVRRNLHGRTVARPALGNALNTTADNPQSLTRLNDPYLPGYALIIGAAGKMYVNAAAVATGLSGAPLSFLPYRPPSTPRPWMYVADPSLAVTLSNPAYPQTQCGMLKVRSDGTLYKTGIKEPQVAPSVTVNPGIVTGVTGSGGSGMTPGTYPLVFSGGGGTGAAGTIQVTSSTIVNITVTNGGNGYTSLPTVTAATGGTPPTLTATVSSVGPNWVSYRYIYRSDEGAKSNPSPFSPPQVLPQSSVNGSYKVDSGYAARLTFNASQYEFNSNTIRTSGGVQPGTVTDYVIAHNFGLTLPTGVKVDGVQIALNWAGQYAGTGVLSGVSLFYQGNILGQVKGPGILNQQFVSSGGITITQGGDSDPWGTQLDDVIVNDPTFGFGVQITSLESGGSDRSFLYSFTITVYYTVIAATLTATASDDPQTKFIDIFRQDPGLDNYTFVGTVPNSAPSFSDNLTDLEVVANPILEYDNFEPFPSIDLPRKGVVNIGANGAVTWVSGDVFNPRWLPNNIMLIADSSGSSVPYLLWNRPSSSTAMLVYTTTTSATGYITLGYPPTGTNLAWEIAEPELAAQPSPVIWGPTPDNAGAFYFGVDELNPGDIVWSKGNNFDSAPDTNRMTLTSPTEPMMNGTVTSELTTAFSTDRFWLLYNNFADAIATVTGTAGQQWVPIQSAATRGLYMPHAIDALGAMIGWRAKDGICVSQGGGPEDIITDSIRNLFPQGGQAPAPVAIGGFTVYPPDDTRPDKQIIALVPGYIFYDYQDVNGNPRTLVYDFEAKGWSVDVYSPTVNCHRWAIGNVNQILVGCNDGTVRAFDSTGTEDQTAVILTPSNNNGSTRIVKRIGGVFLRALAASAVTLAFWKDRIQAAITGFTPGTAGTGASETDYLVDFTQSTNADVKDLACSFSWPIGSGNILSEWQPDWTMLPEAVIGWKTGQLSYRQPGWGSIPWIELAYSSTAAVTLVMALAGNQGDTLAPITLTFPSTGGAQIKQFMTLPVNKFKIVGWTANSTQPFTIFADDSVAELNAWGSGTKPIKPFSGQSWLPGATT